MRRLIAIMFLVAALAMLLTACNDDEPEPTATAARGAGERKRAAGCPG